MAGAFRSSRSSSVAAVVPQVRAAIYTRRSTAEDPDSGLTAVDRQRESGEAFIRSQSEQGWTAITDRYDDAGYTGGNTDRPALQRLLADVEAGRIDVILVSRLDRLTRSLVDFVKLHEFLERHGVRLASIVESINTDTPHGRMMVSLLVTFGQYERELIGARTKDKLAAARRHGRFTGGALILGFDRHPSGGRLLVNTDEAKVVRAIFRLFTETRSLVGTLEEIRRRGWTLKRWVTKSGRSYGGGSFDVGALRRLLRNYTYIGKVEFQGKVYDGEHTGIVPPAVFKEAHTILRRNARDPRTSNRNVHGALLRGLIHCGSCGRIMSHQWTRSHGRVHRYYVCKQAMTGGWSTCPTKSIPALAAEEFVVDRIRVIGRDPGLRRATFEAALALVERDRKDARAEIKRLERERARAAREIDRLVVAVADATAKTREALSAGLDKAQDDVDVIKARAKDAEDRLRMADFRHLDEVKLGRALETFDEVWDALLVPERERVLNLLIERLTYDGPTKQLTIEYKSAGIATLAAEVGP